MEGFLVPERFLDKPVLLQGQIGSEKNVLWGFQPCQAPAAANVWFDGVDACDSMTMPKTAPGRAMVSSPLPYYVVCV